MPTNGIVIDKYTVSGDADYINHFDSNGRYIGNTLVKKPEKYCLLIKSNKTEFLVEVSKEISNNTIIGSDWSAPVEKND